jgi:hypothetical protein
MSVWNVFGRLGIVVRRELYKGKDTELAPLRMFFSEFLLGSKEGISKNMGLGVTIFGKLNMRLASHVFGTTQH